MGRLLDRSSATRRLSVLALGIATFCLAIALCALAVIIGVREERAARDMERTPLSSVSGGDLETNGPRWRPFADSVDDTWVDVVVIIPGPGAALPPGLSQWPGPGEVVLPPSLKGTTSGTRIAQRYGRESPDVIGLAGLISRDERVVYWRPSDTVAQSVHGYPLTGFASAASADAWEPQASIGGTGYQRPLPVVMTSYVVLVVLPSLVLFTVAALIGSANRRRTLSILLISGASPLDLGAFLLGSLAKGVLCGTAAAGIAALLLATVDIRVPGAEFTVQAADVRAHSPALLIALAISPVLATMFFLTLNWPRRLQGTRPVPRERSARAWAALFLPATVLLGYILLSGTALWGMNDARIVLIYATVGIVAASLPAFFSFTIQRISSAMTRLGHSCAAPSLTVAGRQILAAPRVTRRLCSGMAILVFLGVTGTILTTFDDPQAAEALASRQAIADRGFLVTRMAPQLPLTPEARASAPPRSAWGAFEVRDTGEAVLTSSCAGLQAFALPCMDRSSHPLPAGNQLFHQLIEPSLLGAGTVTIRVHEPTGTPEEQLFLVSTDGTALPREGIMTTFGHLTAPPMLVETPAQSWIIGLHDTREQQRWTVLMTATSVVFLATAVISAALGDAAQQSHSIGVLRMWGTHRALANRVVLLRVLLPLLIALVCGLVAGLLMTLPLTAPPVNAHLTTAFVWGALVAPLIVAGLLTLATVRTQTAEFDAWHPGRSAR